VTLVELGEWERSALSRLAAVEGRWEELVRGSSLLHFDPRHDNLRITHDQQVWFLDWGRACLGPAWVDPVCLLLESSIGDLDADELFLSTELGAAADPAAVDAFLVVLASYWRHIALQPADAAEEWIRRRQQRSGDATIRWLRKRWS
jgi:thiamine kinase-like enzyme